MDGYLSFVMNHNQDVAFSTIIRNDAEYMDIYMHDVSMYNAKEREIYLKGLYDARR